MKRNWFSVSHYHVCFGCQLVYAFLMQLHRSVLSTRAPRLFAPRSQNLRGALHYLCPMGVKNLIVTPQLMWATFSDRVQQAGGQSFRGHMASVELEAPKVSMGWGMGYPPPRASRRPGLGERRKLTQRDPAQNPGDKTILLLSKHARTPLAANAILKFKNFPKFSKICNKLYTLYW